MTRFGPFLHIIQLVLFVLVQGLLINEIDLGPNTHPLLHILFILALPLELPVWLLMCIAFAYGVCIDTFTSTIGMHTSAMVLLAGARPIVLRLISPRDGYEPGQLPTISFMGIRWFLLYGAIMTLIHHIWYFFIEKMSFADAGDTLMRILLSSLATLILMIITQYLFFRLARR